MTTGFVTSLCAICASDDGPFTKRPLGKNDAMVIVCNACNTEPARLVNGPERPYEAHPENRGWAQKVKDVVRTHNIPGLHDAARGNQLTGERTPGWILIRVLRRDTLNKPRDRAEAARAFEHQPWAPEVRYLGTLGRFHLFERPDSDAAADQRRHDDDALADLRRLEAM